MRDFDIQNGVLVKYNGSDEYVYIPDGVTEIGEAAFREADFIRYVYVPESVTSIGKSAFEFCESLESIELPDSVEYIGENAFFGCEELVIYELPYWLKTIDVFAFGYCTSLTSIDISKNIEDIGFCAFGSCNSLRMINIDPENEKYLSWDGILYNQDKSTLLLYPAGRDMVNGRLIKSVTVVGENAFSGAEIRSIDLRNVRRIEFGAFSGCKEIEEMTLPDGVNYIGERAFAGCKNMTWIDIPDTVTEIGRLAFDECEKMDTYMSQFVEVIGERAFRNCSSLTELYLPPSIREIAYNAFRGCPNVSFKVYRGSYAEQFAQESHKPYTSMDTFCQTHEYDTKTVIKKVWSREQYIELDEEDSIAEDSFDNEHCPAEEITVFIPASITSIERSSWYACTIVDSADVVSFEVDSDNPSFKDIDGVLFSRDGTRLIEYPYGRKDSYYRVPDGVIEIGERAFNWNSNLTEIELPDSLQIIRNDAFIGCSITNITLPVNVTSITAQAFNWCSHLSEIRVAAGNQTYFSRNGVLFADGGKKLVAYPLGNTSSSYKIPSTVEVIGEYAFYRNKYLSEIDFPDDLKTIEGNAFYDCKLLERVDLKGKLVYIGSCAFSYCDNLASVNMEAVVCVCDDAFRNSPIRKLVFPEGLYSIGSTIAYGSELREVHLPSSICFYNIAGDAFESDDELPDGGHITFYVPHGSDAAIYCIMFGRVYEYSDEAPEETETYDTPNGNEYPSDFEIIDGILTSYAGSDTDITVPYGVEVIGDSAFSGKKDIQSITLPDSLTKIDEYAFSGCKQLNWINIPDSVEEIGEFAFSGCKLLESLVLPESVNTIGEDAFTGCGQLVLTVTSGSYAEQYAIDNDIEYCCNSDDYSDDFTVEDGVLTAYTGNETEVTVPNCVVEIADMVFKGHSEITELVLPDNLERIGEYAFSGCKGLTEIVIPYGTRCIGEFAFSGCRNLESVTVPDTVCEIGDCAFSGCKSLNAVVATGSVAESYMEENGVQYSCN
ncbi:MAG: leucine-rich repeat domain-containing protein [Oscillospiraceae bacterium]